MAQKAAQQSQGAQQPGSDKAGEAESAEEMARVRDSESSNSIHVGTLNHLGINRGVCNVNSSRLHQGAQHIVQGAPKTSFHSATRQVHVVIAQIEPNHYQANCC